MASIAIVFRKDKINKNNEAPIHFRIIKNRKPRYITSKIMLHLKHWDFSKNKVKSSYPNSARLNNYLTTKFSEYQNALLESETKDSSRSPEQLREVLIKSKGEDFFAFANSITAKYLRKGQVGTHDKCQSILQKLRDYTSDEFLFFVDITPQFLRDYEKYLSEVKKNKVNTINGNMKFISRVFNAAYENGIIEHKDNPFLKYKKPKIEKTHKEYLTEEEIEQFSNVETDNYSKIGVHKNMFIFSCYGGGERISDLLTLKWKDFDGKYIHFSTNKTETQLSILLPNKSLEILSLYKTNKLNKLDFVFPILPNSLDMENPKELLDSISAATTLINNNLKILAKRAKIEKNISTHTARHTWATRALRKGISIDKVSKLLGHTNIKQTQVYAKIVDAELDKAMLVFNA